MFEEDSVVVFIVGPTVGSTDGYDVTGFIEGTAVGLIVGLLDGFAVGFIEGRRVGFFVGLLDGLAVGWFVGPFVGPAVGLKVGFAVGLFVGSRVGLAVGLKVGFGLVSLRRRRTASRSWLWVFSASEIEGSIGEIELGLEATNKRNTNIIHIETATPLFYFFFQLSQTLQIGKITFRCWSEDLRVMLASAHFLCFLGE